MNRKSLLLAGTVTSVLFFTSSIFAASSVCSTDSEDNVVCGKGVVSSLIVQGDALLKGTTVKGETKIEGKLNANNAQFNKLLKVEGQAYLNNSEALKRSVIEGKLFGSGNTFHAIKVQGNAHITQTEIKGRAIIEGKLVVDRSSLQGKTTIYANRSSFNATTAEDVTLVARKPAKICVKGKTKLNKITFKQHKGTVYLASQKAHVLNIKNGTRVHKECP